MGIRITQSSRVLALSKPLALTTHCNGVHSSLYLHYSFRMDGSVIASIESRPGTTFSFNNTNQAATPTRMDGNSLKQPKLKAKTESTLWIWNGWGNRAFSCRFDLQLNRRNHFQTVTMGVFEDNGFQFVLFGLKCEVFSMYLLIYFIVVCWRWLFEYTLLVRRYLYTSVS